MNNHAGSTLNQPTGSMFSLITLDKVASGGGLSLVLETI